MINLADWEAQNSVQNIMHSVYLLIQSKPSIKSREAVKFAHMWKFPQFPADSFGAFDKWW